MGSVMSKRRVVITGLGQVSPVGNDIASAWQNLLAGRSGIDTITRFDASDLACRIAGEVTATDRIDLEYRQRAVDRGMFRNAL